MKINHPPISIGDEHLQALGFGLAGAHRTGKTTIARKLAELNDCPLICISLSKLATEMGITIGLDMPFDRRVEFQENGLLLMEGVFAAGGEGKLFITDRTPLDMAAYVITAWHPLIATPKQTDWAHGYVERCIEATNRWLFQIGIIQPGIPWVDDEQKGENIEFYREALNSTMIGLASHDDIRAPTYIVPRDVLDLDQRIKALTLAYSRSISEYAQVLKEEYPLQ